MSDKEGEWVVRGSRMSRHCVNPIRTMFEEVFGDALEQRNQDKALIRLSLGETSVWTAGFLPE